MLLSWAEEGRDKKSAELNFTSENEPMNTTRYKAEVILIVQNLLFSYHKYLEPCTRAPLSIHTYIYVHLWVVAIICHEGAETLDKLLSDGLLSEDLITTCGGAVS